MDVHTKVLRKLLNVHYHSTYSSFMPRGNDFQILADLMKDIASSPQTVKQKFADVILDTLGSEGLGRISSSFNTFLELLSLDPL